MINMKTQIINPNEYLKKIIQIESMLNEIKQGLFLSDENFQESIKRGEKDIAEGKVTICKTEKEIDDFFYLI